MRLFVAVVPPADVLDAVGAIPRPHVPHVRWTTRDQWHVTLRFLGAVDDPDAVLAVLHDAPLGGPVHTVLGPAVTRLGDQVLCIPVAGLEALAGEVVAVTAGFGRPPETRPFRGHLTLARATRRAPRDTLRALAGARFHAQFAATEVALVRSRLRRTGAEYDVVGTRLLA